MKRNNISRRKFLKELSFASLAVSIPNILRSQEPLSNIKIAVIGAGLAGLRAAHLLSKVTGIDVTLFESSHRLGGRIFTKYDLFSEGLSTELGGEFIDTGHLEMHSLIKEFGLETIDCYEPETDFSGYDRLIHGVLRKKEYETEWNKYLPTLKFNRDKCESDPRFLNDLDALSLADYIKKYKITGWFADYLKWIFTAEYGLNYNELNCLYLHDMMSKPLTGNPTLFGDVTDQRYKIKGGNQLLINSLANKLSGKILEGHTLNSIIRLENKYNLKFDNGGSFEADYIIMATPLSILRDISFVDVDLSPAKKTMISDATMGTNSKLILGFNERIWRKNKSLGFLITDEFQSGWDSSQLQKNNTGPGTYTFFLGGDRGKQLSGVTLNSIPYIERMELIYKGAKKAYSGNSTSYNWHENPFSKGSYLCLKPGQWSKFPYEEWLKPEGKIYFAGEHCSSKENQGFMNGAAESGRVVTELVLNDIKKRS